MAQTGYTPIQLYYSTTTSNVPSAGNLASGELAINITDGKLFYKDNGGVVRVIAQTSSVTNVASISFGTTGLTPSTATTGAVTVAGTLVAANGGTGQSTYTTGDLLYATGSTALSKLGIGTNGQILTSTGTAPQWSTLSGVAVTTFSAGTTGFTPSTATSGAVTLAGTLATTNGGTGLTSFTANRVFYASSTSAIGSSANLTFDGTTLTVNNLTDSSLTSGRVTYATTGGNLTDNANFVFDGTNLGVGTASPASTVAVAGATSTTLGFSITPSGWNNARHRLTVPTSGDESVWSWNYTGAAIDSASFGTASIGVTSGVIKFSVGATNTAPSEGMRLTSTGLGIGTSSPSAPLQFGKSVYGAVTSEDFYRIKIQDAGGIANDVGIGQPASGAMGFNVVASTGYYQWDLGTNGTAMTLNASGNLGIGTSSPGYKVAAVVTGGADAFFADGNGQSYSGYRIRAGAGGQQWAFRGGTSTMALTDATAGTDRMQIDTSGNLGLGVTPSAWGSNGNLQLTGGRVLAFGTAGGSISSNAYFNAGWKYIGTGTAAKYDQDQTVGAHYWFTAPSGTAGNAISFTQAMTLDSNSNLLVGTTGQINSARLSVADSALKTSSSNTMAFGTATGGATDFQLIFARSAAGSGAYYSIQSVEQSTAYRDLVLQQNGGNVGIGTTSATSKLTVSGGNVAVNVGIYTATNGGNAVQFGAAGQLNFGGGGSDLILATNGANVRFGNWNTNTEFMRLTSVSNLSLGGTADRGTTVGTNAIQIFNGTAPAGTLTNGVSLYSQSGDLRFMDAAGNAYQVGFRNVPQSGSAKTGSYTLATTDVGEFIQISTGGSIVIPTSTFSAGDVVSLFNNTSGNITITCSAPTAYIAGTDTIKTSMTLATRGVATVLFITATLCVVSGNVT